MTDVLHVELREQTGTAATRRLRKIGRTPVVLYGHGEGSVHLSVASSEISALLRHHGKTVRLEGAAKDHALVTEMQWDPLGIEVLHLDLIRVNMEEKVHVTVPVRLTGEPVGVRQGGMLLENRHDVEISCTVNAIPEEVRLATDSLTLGHSLHASDIQLPAGVELVTSPDAVICHIEAPKGGVDADAAAAAGEPEVITRKKEAGAE